VVLIFSDYCVQIYVGPDIQSGVACDVTLMTGVAGEIICSRRHGEETNASHCGANQITAMHEAVPLDETARPDVLMDTGIYLRGDPSGRRVTLSE
jgi:hypothetical protein